MTLAPASTDLPILDEAEARTLTDEVKTDAAALWSKLLRLYEGGAHTTLGYSSWAAYCAAEFDMGKSHAYRILDAARVVDAVPQLGTAPEAVAREMVPVLRDDPDAIEAVWVEAVEEHGPKPTAAQVRETVARKGEFIDDRLVVRDMTADEIAESDATLKRQSQERRAATKRDYGSRARRNRIESVEWSLFTVGSLYRNWARLVEDLQACSPSVRSRVIERLRICAADLDKLATQLEEWLPDTATDPEEQLAAPEED
jgi:hypothetical protein